MNNANDENANKGKSGNFDDFDEIDELLSRSRRRNSIVNSVAIDTREQSLDTTSALASEVSGNKMTEINMGNANHNPQTSVLAQNPIQRRVQRPAGKPAASPRHGTNQNIRSDQVPVQFQDRNPAVGVRRPNSGSRSNPNAVRRDKFAAQPPAANGINSMNDINAANRRDKINRMNSAANSSSDRSGMAGMNRNAKTNGASGINETNAVNRRTGQPKSNKNIVADAKIREGFQRERTEIFNRLENDEQYRNRHRSKNGSDGSYRYAGRDIKSNRQKLVDVQPKPRANMAYDGDRDIIVENKKRQRKNSDSDNSANEGFVMPSVLKVILYLGAVILVSIVIALNIINIANDVFAFVKNPFSVSVDVPENAGIEDIAEILSEKNLIKYPKIFEIYASYRNKSGEFEFVAGEYELSSALNYDEFVSKLKKRTVLEEVRIVIPEGYTIDDIIDTFVAKGIGTRKGFEDVINNYEFDYRFVNLLDEAELSPDRKYRLEGYLFPDTYDFYTTSTEAQVVKKFLDNFNSKFTEDFYDRCDMMGMTVDEVINLASIIEREAGNYDDFPIVSSVFHNRLANSAAFPYLQSNATIQYSMEEHNSDFLFMSAEDLAIDVPYNTYKYPGLPPSAICNPGYEAIFYALEPDQTDYFYFVSKKDGSMLYGRTAAEHSNNVAIIRSE